MIRNLILDWSGTLVDDFSATVVATNVVFEHYGKPAFSHDEFRRDFRLPYPDFYEEFLPGQSLEELEVLFKKAFLEAEDLVVPLAPTLSFLRAAKQKGLRLIVLSSMNEEALLRQAESFGISSYFEAIYGSVLDKREKMGKVIAHHGLEKSETAYVGDMVHDVNAAKAGGVKSVAVLSGYDPVTRLAKASPDIFLSDVSELAGICSLAPMVIRDDVRVRKLRLPVFIGVPDEEREKVQEVKVSLVIETRDGIQGLEDEITRTIDYYEVTEGIKKLAALRPRKLIETLAEEIAQLVVNDFGAAAVRVEVEKPILVNCEGVLVACELRSSSPASMPR